jgi:hypothetical protein
MFGDTIVWQFVQAPSSSLFDSTCDRASVLRGGLVGDETTRADGLVGDETTRADGLVGDETTRAEVLLADADSPVSDKDNGVAADTPLADNDNGVGFDASMRTRSLTTTMQQ